MANADPEFFAIIAAKLKAIRAPASIAFVNGDTPLMCLLSQGELPVFQQQAMIAHDAIYPLGVDDGSRSASD